MTTESDPVQVMLDKIYASGQEAGRLAVECETLRAQLQAREIANPATEGRVAQILFYSLLEIGFAVEHMTPQERRVVGTSMPDILEWMSSRLPVDMRSHITHVLDAQSVSITERKLSVVGDGEDPVPGG